MNAIFYSLVILLLLLSGIYGISYAAERARWTEIQKLLSARAAYLSALAQLKISPTDPTMKQQALQLGRTYATLTRQYIGVPMYDDVALANDISAAIAGATVMA